MPNTPPHHHRRLLAIMILGVVLIMVVWFGIMMYQSLEAIERFGS